LKPALLFIMTLIIFWGCANPFANQQLAMTADPGVTEAWLSLHVDGVKSGADYIVQRDGTTIFKGRLQSPDTVVYDSLLTPATTYTYRFYARENGDNSPALQSTLTTLDTTSHNFSWQIYEFGGQKGSSSFYDVAIIDENDIWAVGEIYTADTYTYDSLGNFIQPYNAAHWDGQKWELVHISPEFRGNKITPEIEGVFSFSSNDIWFCAGGAPVHWDGMNYTMYHLWDMGVLGQTDGGVTKIWGSSPSDIYFVGRTGTIVHYDGRSWTKIESGTDLPIQDIWGAKEPGRNQYKILAIASHLYSADKSTVLEISGTKTATLKTDGLPYSITSVWSTKGMKWYICGDGFYQNNLKDQSWQSVANIPLVFQECIRGDNFNNIFIVGHIGLLVHWNGLSWKDISQGSNVYLSAATKNDLVVAVGYTRSGFVIGAAHILMGKRK